jgi:hypothetical protein
MIIRQQICGPRNRELRSYPKTSALAGVKVKDGKSAFAFEIRPPALIALAASADKVGSRKARHFPLPTSHLFLQNAGVFG